MGRTSAVVKNRYNAKAYDRINLTVPKGQKEAIKDAAEAEGKSVNAYIYEAVREKMERSTPEPPKDDKPPGGYTPIPNVLYK